MKSTLLALLFALAFVPQALLHAADDPKLVKLQTVDDERVAAIIGSNHAPLAKFLAEDLHYAHSTGAVDTKSSFITGLETGRLKYNSYHYEERKFTFPSPGIALMTGSTRIEAVTPNGTVNTVLGFLAVWHEEKGQWQLLAWQSNKLPAPAAK